MTSDEQMDALVQSARLSPGFREIPAAISNDVLGFIASGPTEVWHRPTLTRGQRSMITMALLTALGADHQLRGHIEMALVNNGLTREEVCEVLLHTAMYAGFPAALNSFALAAEVFEQIDAKASSTKGTPAGD
jgi:alkylhydroperoxidase/carboxymuconolactone decarboxylase family protein YurZ